MAYTQARKSKTKGTRYVGYYLDADGKPKVAGTFASDDEALRVAREQEDHVREGRTGTPPAEKATITIEEFAKRTVPPADRDHAEGEANLQVTSEEPRVPVPRPRTDRRDLP